MPPCFSAASAILETTSSDNTAAASVRTLCMFPSLDRSVSTCADYLGRYHDAASRQPARPTAALAIRIKSARVAFSRHCCGGCAQAILPEPSNFQFVAALQIENFAGLVGCRHLEAEAFDDLAGELHLLGVRCRHSAGRRPQRILEPDPDIAAHGGCHRRNG